MEKLTKDDIKNFALTKNTNLSPEELDFIYLFVKKNWEQILKNPKLLNLERYKEHFTEENYHKIAKLIEEYSIKYQAFLR